MKDSALGRGVRALTATTIIYLPGKIIAVILAACACWHLADAFLIHDVLQPAPIEQSIPAEPQDNGEEESLLGRFTNGVKDFVENPELPSLDFTEEIEKTKEITRYLIKLAAAAFGALFALYTWGFIAQVLTMRLQYVRQDQMLRAILESNQLSKLDLMTRNGWSQDELLRQLDAIT